IHFMNDEVKGLLLSFVGGCNARVTSRSAYGGLQDVFADPDVWEQFSSRAHVNVLRFVHTTVRSEAEIPCYSGLIGTCWATLFVSAGYTVCLYDISSTQLDASRQTILKYLQQLRSDGLSRGSITVEEATKLITTTSTLSEALSNAIYAQESTCEDVEFKKRIFVEMDLCVSSSTILASSTSTIPASKFTGTLTHRYHRSQCLVVHPVNPPLYLALVEIVPAPWTKDETVKKAYAIMKDIGQEPVHLHREVLGFAVNRLQYALLAEAWRLVENDVLSTEDVDKVMSAGLGPRYAIHGPLETAHLNANG
ncbi:3-hydroxyacyl-CoA dehydrogenase family protein, partial [Dictyocaulus viviparus]